MQMLENQLACKRNTKQNTYSWHKNKFIWSEEEIIPIKGSTVLMGYIKTKLQT